jgi:hypothetical protein
VAAFFVWANDNWFLLLQSVGIIGGLVFTAESIRQGTKARRISDMLALTEQHRVLWQEVHERPELCRIPKAEVDLVANPITNLEDEFLNLAIVHFNTGWLLTREGALLTSEALARDVRSFFSLPIPRDVWERTKSNRDPEFVRFVESCLHPRRQ